MKKVWEFCWSIRHLSLGLLTSVGVQLVMQPKPEYVVSLGIQVLLLVSMMAGAFVRAGSSRTDLRHSYGVAEVRVEFVGGPKDGGDEMRLVACCTCGWHGDPEQALLVVDARAKALARKAWEQHAASHGAWKP